MIRPILFAGAAMLAIPALAQQTGATGSSDSGPVSATSGASSMSAPGPDGMSTSGPTDAWDSRIGPSGAGGTPGTGTMPETATGVPDDAGRSTTFTGQGGPDDGAMTRNYPLCSRTVTDACRQTARTPRPER